MAQQPVDGAVKAKEAAADADRSLDNAMRKSSFADEVQAVTERQAKLAELGAELRRARSRGWVWGADWESELAGLQPLAERAGRDVRSESAAAVHRVQARMNACRTILTRTAVTAANLAALESLEQEAKAVEEAANQEELRIRAVARPFVEPFDRLQGQLSEAHEHLGRFEEAKFRLAAGEHPYMTGECTWQDGPGGALNGFLYLTDKRIRFEQKETIKTKKFLFFTASSEDKHECLIDEPIGNVARSDDSTKGMVFKDQLVTIVWQNSKLKKTTFDINSGESAKDWDTWIEELRSGQIVHRMASTAAAPAPNQGLPIDAPTRCSACDAGLEAPVRGMTVLVCKYCGQRHDLRFA